MRIEMRKTGKARFSAYGRPTRTGETRVDLATDVALEDLPGVLAGKRDAIDAAKGRTKPA